MSDSLLRDRIVLGIRNEDARKRLLQERKLDLNNNNNNNYNNNNNNNLFTYIAQINKNLIKCALQL